jgi:Skp family chaperone for outer membrane proteins
MDRDEFERKYGEKRTATIIFVPHARAKFRKLKISHRLIFSLMALVTSSLALSTWFSYMYFTSLREELYVRRASTRTLEQELSSASNQMITSSRNLEALTRHLLREQRIREQQLAALQARYESLRALTAGQEKIAAAHREILQHRTLADRFVEIGLGFSVGVLSSLVASFIWYLRSAKPVTAAELDELERESEV